MCTNGGILLFTVFDQRCASSLLVCAILEIIHVAWVYGTENVFDKLSEMNTDEKKPKRFMWTLLWKIVTPPKNFFDNLSEMGMDMNTPSRFIWTILWKFIT